MSTSTRSDMGASYDGSAAFAPEVTAYLRELRAQHSCDSILQRIADFRPLKTLVVGEAILDEYVYCDVMGKSGKEPILAMKYRSEEIHAGGSVVIANHVADFCGSVGLMTYLGSERTKESLIRDSLRDEIAPFFIYKQDSPTILKRRFVEDYLSTKLMEVYVINDEPLAGKEEDALCTELEARLPEFDVVIAADYGHGLISPRVVEVLCRAAKFLAVNTQVNAANNGFHTLARYPRANYACVQEREIRLDQRDRVGDLKTLVTNVSDRMACDMVMVTRGTHGTLLYCAEHGFFESPALSLKVVDRVGAGDAVLAVTSLCAARQTPPDVVGFLANMVGAQAVTIKANRSAVQREHLCMDIRAVLG